MKRHTEYYETFDKDFEEGGAEYKLPDDYVWVKTGLANKIKCKIAYALTWLAATAYCRLVLRIKIVGREKLRLVSGGYFLFGNHTHGPADALLPVVLCSPKHIYTIVSPANLGLKGIGKFLPYIGALPVPERIHKIRDLNKAVYKRIEEGNCVVIYPEGHLWPYCTMIRPFESGCFRYPAATGAPVFSLTMTYQKRKRGKPAMTAFINGPFKPYITGGVNEVKAYKACAESLGLKIRETMLNYADCNTDNYVEYLPVEINKTY